MKIKKIALILAVVLLMSSITSCSSNKPSTKDTEINSETQSEVQTEAISEINVLRRKVQTEGLFEVEFEKDERTYCGIADDKGQIFYYTDDYKTGDYWGIDFTPMGENAVYLCDTINDKEVYTIINSTGDKKTFSEDDFDKIIGEGGGYILVYKNTGNISKEEHSYGLINSNGEWEIKLTPGAKLPTENANNYYESYKYLGNKMFYMTDQYETLRAVFDVANNKSIGFNHGTLETIGENNGKFIVNFNYRGLYSVPCGSEEKEIEGSYMFSTDGPYEKLPDIIIASDKIAMYEEANELQILDIESNTISQYKDFPASHIKNIIPVDKYALIVIYGADDKYYFTVIDSKGEQQFEPKLCADIKQVNFYGDKIIYTADNNCHEMIDNKGEIIISKDKKCGIYIYGNVIKVKKDNSVLYLDKDCNEITFSLK